MGTFAIDMQKFVDEAKGRMDDLNRKAVMLAAQGMVLKSPVGNPELWASNAESAYGRQMHNAFAEAAGKRRMSQKKLKQAYPLKAGKGYVGGRFRANWQFGYGTINKGTTEQTDKSGSSSLGRIEAAVANVHAGGVCWVSNSLPYAQRLEDGWSKQAPIGMVKVTFAELPSQLRAYLRSLP